MINKLELTWIEKTMSRMPLSRMPLSRVCFLTPRNIVLGRSKPKRYPMRNHSQAICYPWRQSSRVREFCRSATEFTSQNGGKPWHYIIIPHTLIDRAYSFNYILSQLRLK